jgi:hypothetical protein
MIYWALRYTFDIICWWTINSRGYHPPIFLVSASALTWFIRNIYYWNLQLLDNVKLRFSSLMHRWSWSILAFLFEAFGFIAPKFWLSNLSILSIDNQGYPRNLVVRNKFDIFFVILIFWLFQLRSHTLSTNSCLKHIAMIINESGIGTAFHS